VDDSTERIINAALALAAIANSCNDVPGAPRCAELEALKEAGWQFTLTIDEIGQTGFQLTGRPNGKGTK
jgi:hypothetical protein